MQRSTMRLAVAGAAALAIAYALTPNSASGAQPRPVAVDGRQHEAPVSTPAPSTSPAGQWVYLGPEVASVSVLAVSPLDSDRLLAAHEPVSDLPVAYDAYSTFDGGLEWTPTPFRSPVNDVAFTNTGALLAARVRHIEYSIDDGATWTQHSIDPNGQVMHHYQQVAMRRDGAGSLWIRTNRFPETEVLRVEPDFSSWDDVTPSMGDGFVVHQLAVSDEQFDTIAVAASSNALYQTRVWVSNDNGETWAAGGAGLPLGNVSDMKWQGSRLLLALGPRCCLSHSGLFASDDMGQTFFPLWGGTFHAPVNSIALDAHDDRRIWIATELDGIRFSSNSGLSWSSAIGGTGGKRAMDVLFDEASGRLWASLAHEGVLLSTDDGHTFSPRSLRLNAVPVTSIAARRDDPAALAVSSESAVGGRSQVFVSSDGGLDWTSQDFRYALWSRRARFDPEGQLYATIHTLSRNVLVRKEADGTWTEVGFKWREGELGLMADVQFGQDADTILLAGHTHPFEEKPRLPAIWRSTDAGSKWERVFEGASQSDRIAQIERIPRGRGTRLLALEKSSFSMNLTGKLLISDDNGATWQAPEAPPPPFSEGALCHDGDSTLYLVADVHSQSRLFRSVDSGESWLPTGWQPGYTWQDGRPFTALFCGGKPQKLVVGNRLGAVFISDDGGESFQPFDQGLRLAQDMIHGFMATQAGLYGATHNGLWFHPDIRMVSERPRGLLVVAQHARMRTLVRLEWTGGKGLVDVRLGGVTVATVANTGTHSQSIMAFHEVGSRVWEVCNAGTSECSAKVTH